MEDTASWKGHSFTLLVFGGIVALCSIFFVLGMLVGRNQGQRMADAAMAEAASQQSPETAKITSDLSYAGASQETSQLQTRPSVEKPEPPAEPEFAANKTDTAKPSAPAAKPAAKPAEKPAGARIYLQIAAVRQQKDAQRELQNVKSKGFNSALILAPAAGDPAPFYRVQVGPYATDAEANAAKKQLESKGFKQVLVKK